MAYQKGDVVLINFPNSDLKTAKLRPALIVQSGALETGLMQTIVIAITSKLFRAGLPSRVLIETSSPEWQQSGLKRSSVVIADNIVTVQNIDISTIIGRLPMGRIDLALRHVLDL